jgi:uncharacterized protein YjdB
MTGISMNISEVSLVKGESKKLTVTVIPANTTDDTTLTYSSSNGAVASVSADGTITANTCGSAVVTASVGGFTATCNVTVPHTYGNEQIIKQATLSSDGSMGKICTSDGDVLITSTIYSISSITLNQPILTYTGKNQTPTVIVKDRNGNVISPEYFSVTFPSKSKAIGSYSAQVTFSGKYSGSKNLSYTIGPKVPKAKLSGATKKSMVVKWKKISGVNGYEVQYSTTSNFETYKKTTTTSVSKTISKLTKKKKYYVRVRSYKTVKVNKVSIKIYSNWSDVKSLTTKK